MTADDRCPWASGGSELMTAYHDTEWGVPSHDEGYLFELLLLEGAQAGLSWNTVLNKRENYRAALDGFDPRRIVEYGPEKLEALLADPGIVRNRLKVASVVKNARAFLAVQREYGSFDAYLWGWVDGEPVADRPKPGQAPPASTPLSDRIAKDLKKRGFTFVGTTIVYAYLQAVGVVNGHTTTCPAGERVRQAA
ncbi:DNA-3-methyladenine glycosylase I [Streptomyces sp. PTM05]|uniref:DNA-3-methyladenine glycosylase I n=1 Tax=Streptantibioticus parmotrematis TaxID=2873249 RepID=A0ABS7QR32_9ACTN|nr:DNA-3-methyladenine glycosylase I [Streptantibioticus parmotrematis]MBY8884835.1 DNA-3-methyladenine glycosylase I [Streptantibioticus parmotrematis]